MQITMYRRLSAGRHIMPISWLLLIAITAAWGSELTARGVRIRLGAPPLFGRVDPSVSLWLLPCLLVAVGAVVVIPAIVERISWSRLLSLTFTLALVWPLTLALAAGPGGVTAGLESHHDYLHAIASLGSLPELWSSFVDRIAEFPVHVQGHPPGFPTLLALMDRMGLEGSGWATALVLMGAGLAPIAVLIALRDVADEAEARKAAPFLVLSPAAIWIATSADAFFAGIGACAVTLAIIASSRTPINRALFALAAGLLAAVSLLLSYGLALLTIVALPILISRRAWDVIVVALSTAVVSLGVVALVWGFNILEGIAATRERYLVGVSAQRPFTFFLIANLAAFAVVLGPAVFASIRDVPARLLPIAAGAGAAIALADLSGMSKGEVERIWLPFAPWLLWIAGIGDRGSRRTRLGLQLVTALTVVSVVVTPW